jgi:hypothetical protein
MRNAHAQFNYFRETHRIADIINHYWKTLYYSHTPTLYRRRRRDFGRRGGALTCDDRRRQFNIGGGGDVRGRGNIFIANIFNNIEEDLKYLVLCNSIINRLFD